MKKAKLLKVTKKPKMLPLSHFNQLSKPTPKRVKYKRNINFSESRAPKFSFSGDTQKQKEKVRQKASTALNDEVQFHRMGADKKILPQSFGRISLNQLAHRCEAVCPCPVQRYLAGKHVVWQFLM